MLNCFPFQTGPQALPGQVTAQEGCHWDQGTALPPYRSARAALSGRADAAQIHLGRRGDLRQEADGTVRQVPAEGKTINHYF